MSVEIACTCDGLPAHSHRYELVMQAGKILEKRDTGEIRIWVDWKAVAHELAITLIDVANP